MAFPNSNISDIVATTLENRSSTIADNVSNNNPLLLRLKKTGRIKPLNGGRVIWQPISFAENPNGGWYSGYDLLPVNAADVLSGAEFAWKQYACAVTISGLEELQNSGEDALFDLMEERIKVAESTMANDIEVGMYSDGTAFNGKSITGLEAAVPQDPTTGTYGGINRANYPVWRPQLYDAPATPVVSTIQGYMNTLWSMCLRGADKPDLILAGGTIYGTYLASLQGAQQFVNTDVADAGFTTVKYMGADVVNVGGVGAVFTATDMLFLNTKYLMFRPHAKRNMVPIGRNRTAVNQDAAVSILGWAGNLVCSGQRFQGRLKGD